MDLSIVREQRGKMKKSRDTLWCREDKERGPKEVGDKEGGKTIAARSLCRELAFQLVLHF